MRHREKGFTLIEILVVVMIIGVLAVAGVNQYLKSAESQRAELGSDLVSQVAHANLLYYADRMSYVSGAITNTLCSGQTACPSGNGACSLISCGYLKLRNFDNQPYMVWAGNGDASSPACGDGGIAGMNPASVVACGRRRKDTDTGTYGSSITTYQGWGYAMNKNGAMTKMGTGAPDFSQ
jgi:prepilin-type N-terminal cleavage/methylation domain-containing protein